jgi:hypothetical protein
MTKPKMVQCEGSGQKVYGPDEPDGTVQCFKCGRSFLPMKRTKLPNGKTELSVSDHERRANPPRRKGSRPVPPKRRRVAQRNSGRRR